MKQETKDKIRKGVLRAHREGRLNSPEALKKLALSQIRKWKEKLLNDDFDSMSRQRKRKRILIEQDYKCNKCEIVDWRGEHISFEMHHIDGNRNNNERKNLEVICPNCHSQTDTWKAKTNHKNKLKFSEIPKKDLIKKFRELGSIRQVLIFYNFAPKGSNYRTIKEIILDQRI